MVWRAGWRVARRNVSVPLRSGLKSDGEELCTPLSCCSYRLQHDAAGELGCVRRVANGGRDVDSIAYFTNLTESSRQARRDDALLLADCNCPSKSKPRKLEPRIGTPFDRLLQGRRIAVEIPLSFESLLANTL